MNIYYELPTNRTFVIRFWVQSNVGKRNGQVINYRTNLMLVSERVWLEEDDGEVKYLKNRWGRIHEGTIDDTELFNKVKSLARDLDMMSMRKFSEDVVYVAFPPKGYHNDSYLIPKGLEEWLEANTTPDWGVVKGERAGVFLSEQDATAFKLRWM